MTIAGIYNANGGLKNGTAARFQDFHPEHALDETEGVDSMEAVLRGAVSALNLQEIN